MKNKRGNIRPFTGFGKKIIGLPYRPVKWRDNRTKVDVILFILAILYTSLHMMLGSGGSDERGWTPGIIIFNSQVILPLYMGLVWRRLLQGRKR